MIGFTISYTEKKELEQCFRQLSLSNVKVLGCVLNESKDGKGSYSKYKKYYGLQKQMEAAVPTVGVIMDCRQLHGSGTASKNGKVKAYKKGAYPFLYEFSVAYRCEDGMQHISFFGVRAKEPLPYSIADSVSMWRFPQPLAPVPQWIFDEGRSVDGRLPQQVFHHAWYG